jgi:putative transposase
MYYCVRGTPKYGRPVRVGPMAKRCEQVLRQVAAKYRPEILALEILPDHHGLLDADPQLGTQRLAKHLKGVSSHSLRQEFRTLQSRPPNLWTKRYFLGHGGRGAPAVIKQYVGNQKNV